MTNYEIQAGHTLLLDGVFYKAKTIMPDWFVDRDGGLAGRIAEGALKPVPDGIPCTQEFGVPFAKTHEDPVPALEHEVERLRRENVAFAASNKELVARDIARDAANLSLTAALGKATIEIDGLRSAVEKNTAERAARESEIAALRAEVEKLTADLATATAPKATPQRTRTKPDREPAMVPAG